MREGSPPSAKSKRRQKVRDFPYAARRRLCDKAQKFFYRAYYNARYNPVHKPAEHDKHVGEVELQKARRRENRNFDKAYEISERGKYRHAGNVSYSENFFHKKAPFGARKNDSFTIRTVTVGFGIAPNRAARLADYTAGKELHLTPKNLKLFCFLARTCFQPSGTVQLFYITFFRDMQELE